VPLPSSSCTTLEELPALAAALPPLQPDPQLGAPGDLAELVFTSGTTGTPKAVMLTQANLLTSVRFGRQAFPPTPRNRVLSLLPLSHLFEQAGGLFVPLSGGAAIGYTDSTRPAGVAAALRYYRVTNLTVVPRVLQLFRAEIEAELGRRGQTQTFTRLQRLAGGLPYALRRVLFRPVLTRLGGALRYVVCGGAPLDPALARWWERLGIVVAQGYGLTEAGPVVAGNTLRDRDIDSVGRPLPGVAVAFADDGEILVRGPNITPGYWLDPAATAAAFTDGWFRTGDLGFRDAAGRLHLVGRTKTLIVLPSGQKVSPEAVERLLMADPRVQDAVVLGLARGADVMLHAVLIGPDPRTAADVVKAVNRQLAPYQRLRGVSVWPESTFPLTPTLKPQRDRLARWVEACEPDELASLDAPPTPADHDGRVGVSGPQRE
jgi:long-chain acyl-CoA synthetase